MSKTTKQPFSVRTTLLLVIGVIAGVAVGVLTFAAGGDPATSVVAGLGAGAATLTGANAMIADE